AQRLGRLLADRVAVLAGDAEQVALHEHGPAAAQGLGDVADAAGGQGHGLALRDQDGLGVALAAHRFAAACIHVRWMGAHGPRGKAVIVSPRPGYPVRPSATQPPACRHHATPGPPSLWDGCSWAASAWRPHGSCSRWRSTRSAAGWRW